MDRSLRGHVEAREVWKVEHGPVSYRNICAGIGDPSDCRLCVWLLLRTLSQLWFGK